nr:MYXO-CTERM sorting domain-containing protein [Kofleriaceae bacterium]
MRASRSFLLAIAAAAAAASGCLAEIEGGDGETSGGEGGGGGDADFIGYTLPSPTVSAAGELRFAIVQWHTEGADLANLVRVGSDGGFQWQPLALGTGDHPTGLQLETIGDHSLLVWADLAGEQTYAALLDVTGDGVTGAHELELADGFSRLRRVGDRYLVITSPRDGSPLWTGLWLLADGRVDAPLAIPRAPGDDLAFAGDDPYGSVGEIPLVVRRSGSAGTEMRVARVTAGGEVLPDVVVAASPEVMPGVAVELADHRVVASYSDMDAPFAVALPPEPRHHPLDAPPALHPVRAPAIVAMVATTGGTSIGAIGTTGVTDDRDVAPLAAYELDPSGETVAGPTPAGDGQPNLVVAVATPAGFATFANVEDDAVMASFGSNAALAAPPDDFAHSGDAGCNTGGGGNSSTAALLALALAVARRRGIGT